MLKILTYVQYSNNIKCKADNFSLTVTSASK